MRAQTTGLLTILLLLLIDTVYGQEEFNIPVVKKVKLKYPDIKNILAKFHKKDGRSGELRPFPKGTILDYLRKHRTKVPKIHPAFGAFFNMIVNICEAILTKFKTRLIPKYFKILGKSLRGLGSGSFIRETIKDFSKNLVRLSAYEGTVLRMYVIAFLDVISNENPEMVKFFHTVNALYSSRDDTFMDDYVFFVTKYGRGFPGPMRERTERLLKDLIFKRLRHQDDDVRDDIVEKLSAICDALYFEW